MTTSTTIVLIIAVVAVSAALLAWFVIDVGTESMARYRAVFTERTQFQAQEFFLFIAPQKLFAANLAVMALDALGAFLASGSVLIAIPVFFALALLPRWLYALMRKRRLRKFDEQLP